MKMTPLLSGRRGRGWRVAASAFPATTRSPFLMRRGIIFMRGGELKDKDPFDRILMAQATVEGMALLTVDPVVARYRGPVRKV
jgi:PIN domain nuclease of toxin-antitoxin system